MTTLNDDRFDATLRLAAQRLRDRAISMADTDEAWSDFVHAHGPNVAVGPTPRRVGRPRARAVAMAAVGIAAACIAALLWLPESEQPLQPLDTTIVPSTGVTTTLPADPVLPADASEALVLPALPDAKIVASLSAVSDSEWFALSDLGDASTPTMLHTLDAGATWANVPISSGGAGSAGRLHFADSMNGWWAVHNCCLLSTHDGGVTWRVVSNVSPFAPGAPSADESLLRSGDVQPIASADGRVYVFGDLPIDGNSRLVIFSSPVERDEFTPSRTTMGDVRWALDPNSRQLVVRGAAGWAVAFGTTQGSRWSPDLYSLEGAARLVDGEWVPWVVPCAMPLDDEEPYTTVKVPRVLLGASPSGDSVSIVCSDNDGGQLSAYVSSDGGQTFTEGTRLPVGTTISGRSWIEMPDDGSILVGVTTSTGQPAIATSTDGGASWTFDVVFSDTGDFETVATTPTGRIVVVAGIGDRATNRTQEAVTRESDGQWLRIETATAPASTP